VLSEAEFAAELGAAGPTLWCIAAGVLGSRNDVEDVVQDAAIIGLRKVESFERGTSFSAWMGQIVRNVARNRARQSRRERAAPLEGVPGEQAPAEAPEDGFDRRVLAALQTLDETARACLLLRSVREMSYRDIAAVLDIPEGTAMSHVSRARKRLRDRLRHHEDLAPGTQTGA
jgi:RNA polymerase sigma-70 factor (ECF subfamily)